MKIMEDIKFRYSVKRENGFYFEKIYTLKQIENGDVKQWIKANCIYNEDVINKDHYIGINDNSKEKEELYENDIVEVYIEYDFVTDILSVIGVIEYNEEECCYYIDFPKWGMKQPLNSLIDEGIIKKGNYYMDVALLELEEEK